jgi:hypothetical protein
MSRSALIEFGAFWLVQVSGICLAGVGNELGSVDAEA